MNWQSILAISIPIGIPIMISTIGGIALWLLKHYSKKFDLYQDYRIRSHLWEFHYEIKHLKLQVDKQDIIPWLVRARAHKINGSITNVIKVLDQYIAHQQ